MRVQKQTPPLKVIRAFPIEQSGALVHLHNISGGILGGDHLTLMIDMEANTHVQLTSTSATRLYKSSTDAAPAQQINTIHVGANSLLEYVPDPLIPFAGSRYQQHSHITLDEGAGLFWWETVAPGRTARNETFAYHLLELGLTIQTQQRPLAIERFRLEPAKHAISSRARLGDYLYITSFYICKVGTPATQWQQLEKELQVLAQHYTSPGETQWGVSTLVSDGLVVKAVSRRGNDIATILHAFWQATKQALYGRDAQLPRKIY